MLFVQEALNYFMIIFIEYLKLNLFKIPRIIIFTRVQISLFANEFPLTTLIVKALFSIFIKIETISACVIFNIKVIPIYNLESKIFKMTNELI